MRRVRDIPHHQDQDPNPSHPVPNPVSSRHICLITKPAHCSSTRLPFQPSVQRKISPPQQSHSRIAIASATACVRCCAFRQVGLSIFARLLWLDATDPLIHKVSASVTVHQASVSKKSSPRYHLHVSHFLHQSRL
jgi:hypothetical protein